VLVLGSASFGCSTRYKPVAGPRISIVLEGGSPAYVKDGVSHSPGIVGGGLIEVVADDPQALEAAKSYRSRMTGGLVLTGVGLGCTIAGTVLLLESVADRSGESHTTRNAFTVGTLICAVGATIAGSVLVTSAQPYHWDAINIYNDHVDQRRAVLPGVGIPTALPPPPVQPIPAAPPPPPPPPPAPPPP
jgi:hypothetical protein